MKVLHLPMTKLLTLALTCLAAVASAQNALDKSRPLNAERTQITGDFNKAQAQLRAAKTESDREAAHALIAEVARKADTLRGYIIQGNNDVITALNTQRYGKQDRSATIKAVTAKLEQANQTLSALPLPAGPQFNPAEINQIQRVLDVSRTTLDLHKHACQNLPK